MLEEMKMTGVWVFFGFVLLQGCFCTESNHYGSEEITLLRSLLRELKRQQTGSDGTPPPLGDDDGPDNGQDDINGTDDNDDNDGPDDTDSSDNIGSQDAQEPDDNDSDQNGPDDDDGQDHTRGIEPSVYRGFSTPGPNGTPVPPDGNDNNDNGPGDSNGPDDDDVGNDNGSDDVGGDSNDVGNDNGPDDSNGPDDDDVGNHSDDDNDNDSNGDDGDDSDDDGTTDNDQSGGSEGTDDQGTLPSRAYRDLAESKPKLALPDPEPTQHSRRGSGRARKPGTRRPGPKPEIDTLLGRTCPILKEILPAYFTRFPHGDFTNDIDYSNIVLETKDFVKTVFRLYRLLRKPKIVADDSTLMLARYILDKRMKCPATKLQQAMLHVVRKLLVSQFKMEDNTLTMNLTRILEDVKFRTEAEKVGLINGIVWGLHHILFREFNDEFAAKEFIPLERFLRRFRSVLPKYLRMANDGETKLLMAMMRMKVQHVRAFSCTPPERVFKIHSMAMQKFMKRFQEEQAIGVLTTEVQVIFNEIFQFLPEVERNKVTGQLLYVIKNYVIDLVDKAMNYESLLATKLFNKDVHGFIFDVLSSEEKTYLITLLQHLGFSGITMPTHMPPTVEPTNMPPTVEPTNMPPTVEPTNMPPTDMPPNTVPTGQPNTVPLPATTDMPTTDLPVTSGPEPSRRYFKSYEFLNERSDLASGDMDLRSDLASGDMDLRSDLASGDMDLRSDLASGDMDLRSDLASGDMDLRSGFASGDVDLRSGFASGDVDLRSDLASNYMNEDNENFQDNFDVRSGLASADRNNKIMDP